MIKDDKRYEDFIKFSIYDLKNKGVCYLYHKYQIEEIKKIMPNIKVIKDDWYYRVEVKNDKENW